MWTQFRASTCVVLALAAGAASTFFACRPDDHTRPPRATAGTTSGFQSQDAGFCGSEFHAPVGKAPLLYFVVDTSGSMQEPIGGETKYALLERAATDVVESLGALIRVGAATFPSGDAGCIPGKEVMAPQDGDPDGTTRTVAAFKKAIHRTPAGGTPTAATLAALRPHFSKPTEGDGPSAIILITDGGPNCNPSLQCGPEDCMLNIEGACPGPQSCCSDDDMLFCLDRGAALSAIASFREVNTLVYVVGLALNPAYDGLMSQMALAGGTARSTAPYYYPAADASELSERLREIAGSLVSCTFVLAEPPEDPSLLNVYFGNEVVPFDPQDGWQWRDERTIEAVGGACQQLKQGNVNAVNFVTGCPTVTPS